MSKQSTPSQSRSAAVANSAAPEAVPLLQVVEPADPDSTRATARRATIAVDETRDDGEDDDEHSALAFTTPPLTARDVHASEEGFAEPPDHESESVEFPEPPNNGVCALSFFVASAASNGVAHARRAAVPELGARVPRWARLGARLASTMG